MKIVIDISDEWKTRIEYNRRPNTIECGELVASIWRGKILPKEHGRLSDMDELVKNIVKEYGVNSIYELPQDIKMFYDKFIKSAPTILDATFDYKLKNYAFLLPPCEMCKTESEE